MAESAARQFRISDGQTLVGDIGGPQDAPLVVLLHGGGQTRHSWSGAMRALVARGYRVINLDARGHGESDWAPSGAYDPLSRVEDVRAVVEDCATPYALVGASMGGLTSISGVGNGLRPAALVLVDIVPQMEMSGVERIVAFMTSHHAGFASLEEAADAVAAYYPERPRPKDPSGLMKNLRERGDGRLYWHWDPRQFAVEDPGNFRDLLRNSADELGRQRDVAVLVVRGLLSDMVSQAGVDAFRAQVPHAQLADVAGAGHMVAGDRNDAFNAAVGTFLAEHLPL